MQKEPTIKELMHAVGVLALDPESKNNYVDETAWFQYLKKAIKQLKKENKMLKQTRRAEKIDQMNKAMELAGKIAESVSQVAKLQLHRKSEISYKPGGVEIPTNRFGTPLEELIIKKDRPVAEFKCAKTNKPSMPGGYMCIVQGCMSLRQLFQETAWDGSEWASSRNVLAFTETSPEQIIKALNNG